LLSRINPAANPQQAAVTKTGEEQALAALLAAEEVATNVRELLALRRRVLLLEAKPAQQARKRAQSRERAGAKRKP
jgi:hypothetical protein